MGIKIVLDNPRELKANVKRLLRCGGAGSYDLGPLSGKVTMLPGEYSSTGLTRWWSKAPDYERCHVRTAVEGLLISLINESEIDYAHELLWFASEVSISEDTAQRLANAALGFKGERPEFETAVLALLTTVNPKLDEAFWVAVGNITPKFVPMALSGLVRHGKEAAICYLDTRRDKEAFIQILRLKLGH